MRSGFVCQALESRRLLSAVTAALDPLCGLLTVTGTPAADQILLRRTAIASTPRFNIEIVAGTPQRVVYAARSELVKRISVNAGNGNDTVTLAANAALAVAQPVTISGGCGNDRLVGGPFNDTLIGDAGNDQLLGYGGDDTIRGCDGDDYLNGGAGRDKLTGDNGNDTLVAIDAGVLDTISGNAGNDIVWADRGTGTTRDVITDASAYEAGRTVRLVTSFANRVDKTLDGDRIADPTDETTYRSFAGKPLFGPAGPTVNDVDQGDLGDCWLVAQLGAIAQSAPLTVRATVVDFADNTYGVALGNNFYRVDADLPVYAGGVSPKFAGLGDGGSLWVAIVEKAFAIHRFAVAGGDTRGKYRDVEYGDSAEALRAVNATNVGFTYHAEGAGTAFTAELLTKWNGRQALVLSTGYFAPVDLVPCHTYTVTSVTRDAAGKVTSFRVRNPWGPDSGNPFIDLAPAKLAGSEFWLGWGNVGLAA